MTDNPLDRVPVHDRVSIRAVLVQEGEDLNAALTAAGIHDPIAVPVVFGETADLSGGILGDGVTPNLTAVLETISEDTEEPDASTEAPPASPPRTSPPAAPVTAAPVTARLPAAHGMQPLAPVRRATAAPPPAPSLDPVAAKR